MSQMTFAIRLTAKDETQQAISSALSGIAGIGKQAVTLPIKFVFKAAELAAHINQGLKPLTEGIERAVDKALEGGMYKKIFANLAGLGGRGGAAEALARQLQQAAHGTIELDAAMRLANKAMASGLNVSRDLPIIFDFASRKAASLGESVEGMLSQMFAGFARGETSRVFETLGILQKGAEGVRRDFESIHGAKSWEALSPAAQQAEMVRQATAEMRQQMGRLGVSGNEAYFAWRNIRVQIADAVDDLFEAVGKSKDFQQILRGVRDVVAGIAQHVQRGGSIVDVLTGGKSGGLLGGLKAALLDVTEWIGKGILAGILRGLNEMPKLFEKIKGRLRTLWDDGLNRVEDRFKKISQTFRDDFTAAVTPVLDRLRPLIDWVSKQLGGKATSQPSGEAAVAAAPGELGKEALVHGGAYGVGRLSRMVSRQAAAEAASAAALRPAALAGDVVGAGGLGTSITGMLARKTLGLLGPAAVGLDFAWTAGKYGYANYDYYRALQEQAQAQDVLRRTQEMARQRQSAASSEQPLTLGLPGEEPLGLGLGMGFGLWNGLGGIAVRSASYLRRMADRVANATGVNRFGKWFTEFTGEHPARPAEDAADVAMPVSALDAGAYPLTLHEQRQRKREIYKINQEIRKEQAAQDHKDKFLIARLRTARAKELRGQGADVRRGDWYGIEQEIGERLRAEREGRLEGLVQRRNELYGELETSTRARAMEPFERRRGLHRVPERPGDYGPVDKTDTRGQTDPLVAAAGALTATGMLVAQELAGDRARLQAAGPRRR